MKKFLPTFLKLNFTPNSLSCFGFNKHVHLQIFLTNVHPTLCFGNIPYKSPKEDS